MAYEVMFLAVILCALLAMMLVYTASKFTTWLCGFMTGEGVDE